MEARNRTLEIWFSRIASKQLTLPRFQRHEAWAPQQVESLLETVIAGLPAGAVLVLEVAGKKNSLPVRWPARLKKEIMLSNSSSTASSA